MYYPILSITNIPAPCSNESIGIGILIVKGLPESGQHNTDRSEDTLEISDHIEPLEIVKIVQFDIETCSN